MTDALAAWEDADTKWPVDSGNEQGAKARYLGISHSAWLIVSYTCYQTRTATNIVVDSRDHFRVHICHYIGSSWRLDLR